MADIIQIKQDGVDKYPITKPECVIDENGKTIQQMMARYGVVSQTQTWTEDTDGGYSYVMSDLVRGWIPQANIDLFVSAGAVFNEESGYFELNGLTDISYQEMQNIHNYTIPFSLGVSNAVALGWKLPIRTAYALKAKRYNIFTTSWAYFFWQSENLEKLVFEDVVLTNNLQFAFNNCNKLAKIDGVFYIAGISSAGSINNAFFQCYSLEDVRLMLLKVSVSFESSPRLSTDSILYMIENEIATSAITITLHATAYARAMADTRITSALETHTNITLASA